MKTVLTSIKTTLLVWAACMLCQLAVAQQTPPGNALHFDGNGYVVADNLPFIGGQDSESFAIEAWIKPDELYDLTTYNIITIGHTGSTERDDPLSLTYYNGKFTVKYMREIQGHSFSSVMTTFDPAGEVMLIPHQWNRIALGYDDRDFFYMWVNGRLVKPFLSGVNSRSAALFRFGLETYISLGKNLNTTTNAGIENFVGSMDEVKIWLSGRLPTQMENDLFTPHVSGTDREGDNLILYYNFDNQGIAGADNTGNAAATQLTDFSGSNVNGTLYGFDLTGNTGNWVESYAMIMPVTSQATDMTPDGFTTHWAAPTLGVVESYQVMIATDSLFTQIVPGYDNLVAPPTATSLAVTGLQPGTTYYYKVKAQKASVAGHGSFSGRIAVKTIGIPTITSFTPTHRYIGEQVFINGSNFTAVTAVTIGGTAPSAYTLVNDNLITVEVGIGNSGIIAITTAAGTGYSTDAFTFMRPLFVAGISPTSGNTGTLVTISGQGFLFASAVRFGGTAPSSFTVVDDETITAVITTGSTGDVTVTNTTEYTLPGAFTYIPPSPVVTGISPTSGTIGTAVTFTGSNFTGTTAVSLGGVPLGAFTVVTDTQITGIIGAGATGGVTVTNGVDYTLPDAFTYIPGPTAPGNALQFDGVDDYVTLAGNATNPLFTIEFWMKTSQNTDAYLIDAYTGNNFGFSIYMSEGTLVLLVRNTVNTYLLSSSKVNTGNWVHVAVARTALNGTFKLFINGVLEKQTTTGLGYGALTSSPTVTIGRQIVGQTNYFKGSIDEYRYLGSDRSAVIPDDMITTSPTGTTILSSYHFDQGTAGGDNLNQTTLVDAGSKNFAGTLHNFALNETTSNWVESYAMVVPKATAADKLSGSSFTANWTAPTLGTVNHYYVDVTPYFFEGTFLPVDGFTNLVADANTSSLVITGLSPSTTYYYRVRADKTSVTGDGKYSNIITATTNTCTPGADMLAANTNEGNGSIASGQSILLMVDGSGCREVAGLQSMGSSPVAGNIAATVWVDATQPDKYVKRHYEITPVTADGITPAANASTATGKVTLYFTQQEFDDFNDANSTQLPKNPTDIEGNIPNLRIEKRSGTSSDGSGLPNTYPAVTPETFKPADKNGSVVWNSTAARWEISFDVTGFSGFFVKTAGTALPLRLISFTGTQEANKNNLKWQTADEVNTKSFELESSRDGRNFQKVATIDAASTGNNSYDYTDTNAYKGILYYRLKMIDIDGTFSYSRLVWISRDGQNSINLFPNPVADQLNLNLDKSLINSDAKLYNATGRLQQSIKIASTEELVNVKKLTSGVYIIKFKDGSTRTFVKE